MIHGKRPKLQKPPPPPPTNHKQTMIDHFEDALQNCDFSKTVAMLDFFKNLGQTIGDLPVNPWLGYAAFHCGDYQKAIETYREILEKDGSCDPIHHLNLACAYFCSGMHVEALESAKRGPSCNLRNRLLFHLAHKMGDEHRVADLHASLEDTVEDQLSLAAMHFYRYHYQEATDIYKRILLASHEYLALNVYIALCYYKLDYYDVSLEVLNMYLQSHQHSAIAINLKACNHYRLYNGKAAEQELRALIDLQSFAYNVDSDVVKHNLVVFRNGDDAFQVLPPLIDVIVPEARLNLVIFHLRNDQIQDAYDLIKVLEPVTPQEHILKAVVYSLMGQETKNQEYLKTARDLFQIVGASPSECDTIPGRQCMASCFFLLKQFQDVLIYLTSIKAYFHTDDTFNYLYGITCAATGNFEEAEECLSSVKNEKIKQEFTYMGWLVRSHIMQKHTKKAWELYLKIETGNDSFLMLQIIANDCYKIGAFYYAAKAFDVLDRLDGSSEYFDGLKGACVGVLQQVAANKEPPDALWDIIRILELTAKNYMEQPDKKEQATKCEKIVYVMRNWAKDSDIRKGVKSR